MVQHLVFCTVENFIFVPYMSVTFTFFCLHMRFVNAVVINYVLDDSKRIILLQGSLPNDDYTNTETGINRGNMDGYSALRLYVRPSAVIVKCI